MLLFSITRILSAAGGAYPVGDEDGRLGASEFSELAEHLCFSDGVQRAVGSSRTTRSPRFIMPLAMAGFCHSPPEARLRQTPGQAACQGPRGALPVHSPTRFAGLFDGAYDSGACLDLRGI